MATSAPPGGMAPAWPLVMVLMMASGVPPQIQSLSVRCQILEKIPFIASVDPLRRARRLELTDLQHPIKVVIYMGNHE